MFSANADSVRQFRKYTPQKGTLKVITLVYSQMYVENRYGSSFVYSAKYATEKKCSTGFCESQNHPRTVRSDIEFEAMRKQTQQLFPFNKPIASNAYVLNGSPRYTKLMIFQFESSTACLFLNLKNGSSAGTGTLLTYSLY